MKRPRGKSSQKGAIELIEEAVHLLRQAPLPTLAAYYIGALPFVIGLLYFWAEMSRSPFAYQHLAGGSLGLAALFLWSILAGFGIFVFLNWITVSLALPALAKTFLGVETALTRSVAAMLNSTFFATMFALTYLTVDPLMKAIYAVRCFYGEALHSG